MMVQFKCDACGRETDNPPPRVIIVTPRPAVALREEFDLCDRCIAAVRDIVGGELLRRALEAPIGYGSRPW